MKIERLRKNRDFLEVIMKNLETKILIADIDARVHEFNDSFMNMLCLDATDIYGKKCGDLLNCSHSLEEQRERGDIPYCHTCPIKISIKDALTKNIPTYKKVISRDCYMNRKKVKKYFLYSCKRINYNNNNMAMVILDDITDSEISKENLKKLSVTDELTTIYNRRFIFQSLEKEIERKERYGSSFSLLMMDIDHFKSVNDRFGHINGDRVLKKTSLTIKEHIRNVDILGRFGGEEFLLILPETDVEHAAMCAERLRKSIENLHLDDINYQITISIGVGEVIHGDNADKIIDRVDTALYKAKENGRNRVEVARNEKTL